MKFTLTITDATADEISKFFAGGMVAPGNIKAAIGVNGPETVQPLNRSVPNNVTAHYVEPLAPVSGEDDGPVNINAPAFDSSGLPWDERIHSANRGTNANGTWRKRRGVSDGLIAGVEVELRARVAPAPHPVEMVMPVAPAPVHVMQPEQFQQQQPVAPTLHPAPAHVVDFMAFMTTLAQKSSHGVIDHPYIMSLTARTGAALGRQMNAITDINNDQNAINTAISIMQQDGKW